MTRHLSRGVTSALFLCVAPSRHLLARRLDCRGRWSTSTARRRVETLAVGILRIESNLCGVGTQLHRQWRCHGDDEGRKRVERRKAVALPAGNQGTTGDDATSPRGREGRRGRNTSGCLRLAALEGNDRTRSFETREAETRPRCFGRRWITTNRWSTTRNLLIYNEFLMTFMNTVINKHDL